MSDATSLHSVVQQFSGMLGISLAAAILALSIRLREAQGVELIDFSVGFLAMAALALISAALCRNFANNAGAELSGSNRS